MERVASEVGVLPVFVSGAKDGASILDGPGPK